MSHWRDRARNDRLNRKRLNVEVSAEHKNKFLVQQNMKHFEQANDDEIHQAVKDDLWRMGGAEAKGAQFKRFMDLVGPVGATTDNYQASPAEILDVGSSIHEE